MPNGPNNGGGDVGRQLGPKPGGEGDVLGGVMRHPGVPDGPRIHTGHTNPPGRPVLPKPEGEPPDPELGGVAERGGGVGSLPREGGDEDHMAAATLEHPLPKLPSESERSPKIDVDHPVKLVEGVVGELPNPRHTSVGDENVNILNSGNKTLKITPRGQVGNNRPPLKLRGKLVENVAAPPSERELTPLSPKPPRDGLPQPAGSTGNENRPPVKFHGRMVIAAGERGPTVASHPCPTHSPLLAILSLLDPHIELRPSLRT
jgi:hypothetical protein